MAPQQVAPGSQPHAGLQGEPQSSGQGVCEARGTLAPLGRGGLAGGIGLHNAGQLVDNELQDLDQQRDVGPALRVYGGKRRLPWAAPCTQFSTQLSNPGPHPLSVCAECSVVSDSVTPWTAACRPLCPWDSPGKNTGLACHALLQGIVLTQGLNLGLLHCRQILNHLSHEEAPSPEAHVK